MNREMQESIELLNKYWGIEVTTAISNSIPINPSRMPFTEFLSYCTACGGNWGGMLLSGIRELFPEVYDAIPDNMGIYAWQCIVSVVILCGIDTLR